MILFRVLFNKIIDIFSPIDLDDFEMIDGWMVRIKPRDVPCITRSGIRICYPCNRDRKGKCNYDW